MTGGFDAADPGTPASAWRRYRDSLPALDVGAVSRLVVLAAHPDDESLVAGALMATVAARDLAVEVVVVTSGEGSHPRSPTMGPAQLARLREQEVAHAVAAAAPAARLHLLQLPDGAVAAHRQAVTDRLRPLIDGTTTVVSTWRRDGHPDHEALGEVAAAVCAAAGAVLLEAPLWAWHWGDPASVGQWPAAVRFDPGPEAVAAKRAALHEHISQTAPLSTAAGDETLLPAALLEHFATDEVFFVSGEARPVDFDGMYAASDDPWGFTDRWYEQRKRAITMASLPDPHYGRALEIGCSIGVTTALLAERCDRVVAVDVAERAVLLARQRTAAQPGVEVLQADLPEYWPDGRFDLVILSETGFYLAGDRLEHLAQRIGGALSADGVFLACHWRPRVVGLDRNGDEVHAVLRAALGLVVTARHEEQDFVLEVFRRPPAQSVAQRTGLR